MSKFLTKIIASLIVLATSLAVIAGCDSGSPSLPKTANVNEALLKNSIELASVIVELAGHEDYIDTVAPVSNFSDIIETVSGLDYATPKRTLLLTIPTENVKAILEQRLNIDGLSDGAVDVVIARVFSTVTSLINSRQGADMLAAASLLATWRAFQLSGFEGMGYIVLQYGDYDCILVALFGSRDNTVVANAMYVNLNDELTQTLEENRIAEHLETLGINGVTVQELS